MAISGTAYDQLQGKLNAPFEFLGDQRLKNIDRPVRAYKVRLDGKSPALLSRVRAIDTRKNSQPYRWNSTAAVEYSAVSVQIAQHVGLVRLDTGNHSAGRLCMPTALDISSFC